MNEDSEPPTFPKWARDYGAVSLIICFGLFVLFWHLAALRPMVWGTVGDLSGWVSALISLGGFIVVICQLQRQHKDASETEKRYREERENQQKEAKEIEQRHRDLIQAQQQIFKQNARIALFEKRYQVNRAIYDFIAFVAENEEFEEKLKREFSFLAMQALYLFPDNKEISDDLLKINELCLQLLELQSKMRDAQDQFKSVAANGFASATIEAIRETGNHLSNQFHKYLRMPNLE